MRSPGTLMVLSLLVLSGLAGPQRIEADTYVLQSGGTVTGELQNVDESPREKYVIRTPAGATVTFDRAQLKHVIPQSAALAEYAKIAPTFADTVDDQWRLAEWCRENSLPVQRDAALERVIQLNPDHREARLGLGYTQLEGKWIRRETALQEQGYVRYKGQWRLPQDVEVLERRDKEDRAQKDWFTKLGRFRSQLDDSQRSSETIEAIQSIDDPFAVPALAHMLNSEPLRNVRQLYIKALARVDTPRAINVLVAHALEDTDVEIREVCIEHLAEKPRPDAVATCISALKSKDNWRVNRAGYALGKLRDSSAIHPLIDALVTAHKYEVTLGSDGMNAGFYRNGGGGMSMGSQTMTVKQDIANQHVLDALVALTGGVNFQFDEKAWKNWHASQKKLSVDTRRD